MSSLNKVQLIGRLGQNPEIRSMQSGGRVCNMSVATSEKWNDKKTGERKEKTEWHRVVIFNKGLIDIVEKYVNKGDQVYLEGQLETRKWQDKAGQDKYTTEVVLRNYTGSLTMLGQAGGSSGGRSQDRKFKSPKANPKPVASEPVDELEDFDDEIPF